MQSAWATLIPKEMCVACSNGDMENTMPISTILFPVLFYNDATIQENTGAGHSPICAGRQLWSGWQLRMQPSCGLPRAAGAGACPDSAAFPPIAMSPMCMALISLTPAHTPKTLMPAIFSSHGPYSMFLDAQSSLSKYPTKSTRLGSSSHDILSNGPMQLASRRLVCRLVVLGMRRSTAA